MKRRHRLRRGGLMIEIIAALSLLAMTTVLLAQITVVRRQHLRIVQQQDAARQEAANAMEYLYAADFEDLNDELAAEVAAKVMHGREQPQCVIRISDSDQLNGKRLDVEVTCAHTQNVALRTVRLTAWRFPQVSASSTSVSSRAEAAP